MGELREQKTAIRNQTTHLRQAVEQAGHALDEERAEKEHLEEELANTTAALEEAERQQQQSHAQQAYLCEEQGALLLESKLGASRQALPMSEKKNQNGHAHACTFVYTHHVTLVAMQQHRKKKKPAANPYPMTHDTHLGVHGSMCMRRCANELEVMCHGDVLCMLQEQLQVAQQRCNFQMTQNPEVLCNNVHINNPIARRRASEASNHHRGGNERKKERKKEQLKQSGSTWRNGSWSTTMRSVCVSHLETKADVTSDLGVHVGLRALPGYDCGSHKTSK